MSKDSDFTKHFIESNAIVSETARILQEQIDKIVKRLEGLEKDLKNARSQLKTKDLEVLRLTELIKTYEKDKSKNSPDLTNQLAEAIDEIKNMSQTIKQSSIVPERFPTVKSISSLDSREIADEDYNNLVEELETKNIEIEKYKQQIIDFKDAELNFKSKIELLEKNLESLSQSETSKALRDIQTQYADALSHNFTLENKIKELENQVIWKDNPNKSDDESLQSLKSEVSKYVQENITLQEINELRISIKELQEENQIFQQTVNYKEDREKELLKSIDELREEHDLLQKTVNIKEDREKELLRSVDDLQAEHDLLQKTVNIKEEHEKELLKSVDYLQHEHDLLQKTVNIKEEREKELLRSVDDLQQEHDLLQKTVNIKEEREKELLRSVDDLQQEHDLLQKTVNFKEEREKELILQIQSLEMRIKRQSEENFELKKDIDEFKKRLNEKEEELLTLKIKANQLDEESEVSSNFEKETLDLEDLINFTENNSQDELLLKISELEMEEANWKDERRTLLLTIEDLKASLKHSTSNEFSNEIMQKKDQIIKSLRNEIMELNQDLDNADAELKELEVNNGVLQDKIGELETVSKDIKQSDLTSDISEDNSQLVYELKLKDSLLDEYSTRLKSQEQKITHLEMLMDQERELKDKFEFLYNNLKNKNETATVTNTEVPKDSRKQFEQVIRSLNQNSKILDLTTSEENNNADSDSNHSAMTDDLSKALENANLYVSLIDKFLKPHVQVTQLLKQGTWEINSLADLIGLDRKKLLNLLQELKEKRILQYDSTNVWLVSDE